LGASGSSIAQQADEVAKLIGELHRQATVLTDHAMPDRKLGEFHFMTDLPVTGFAIGHLRACIS
jgi:hypothetical protein